MDWKVIGQYIAAAAVAYVIPATLQATIEVLTQSGAASSAAGGIAVAALGAVLLHLKSPKQK